MFWRGSACILHGKLGGKLTGYPSGVLFLVVCWQCLAGIRLRISNEYPCMRH